MRVARVVGALTSITLVLVSVLWMQMHRREDSPAPGISAMSALARFSLDLRSASPVAGSAAAMQGQPVAIPRGTAPTRTAGTAAGAAPVSSTCSERRSALGVSRVVEIDTAGGPGFGREHFRMHDFLRDHEVVLTFDDGPWPGRTPSVLNALADHCTKATFFPIGKHATYYPEILKQVSASGHTVGSHTWSHKDLSQKPYVLDLDLAKEEIEKGISAVRVALGRPGAPFFRFPALRHTPELVAYLGARNVAIFSTDMDSFDFTMRRPEQLIKSVMAKLEKNRKGILLMHDFQPQTSEALPELLNLLKANGYKIVQMRAKEPVNTLVKYDEEAAKDSRVPTVSGRPTSLVVRTIDQ